MPDFDWPFFTADEAADAAQEAAEEAEPMPEVKLEGFKPKPAPPMRPCPFCGGTKVDVERVEADPESCTGFFAPTSYRAVCGNTECGAVGPAVQEISSVQRARREARDRWNARAAGG